MKKIACIALLLSFFSAKSQQYPETQLYMVNPYLINPGFTGYLTDLSAFASVLSPITTNNNVIRNYQLGINKSIEKSYLGVGGKLIHDKRDFFESVYIDASFSYQVISDKKQVLSIGSNLGLVNRTFDTGELSPFVDLNDPTLASDYYFKTNFNLGFGLAYYSAQIEAGVAVPHLVEGSEQFDGYLNAYFAYKFYFANDAWMLKPSTFFVNYPDGTSQLQGNVMLARKGIIWGQLGGTSHQALTVATGWSFHEGYEVVFSHLQHLDNELPLNNRTEVMLRVHIGSSRSVLSHIKSRENRK